MLLKWILERKFVLAERRIKKIYMKILMIDYAMPRNKYADGLCKNLSQAHDFRIMIDQKLDPDFSPVYNVMPILYNGGKGKVGAIMDYGISLLKISVNLIKNRYDIVHIQTFKNAEIEMKIYTKLHKYIGKLVHTVHNVLPHEVSASDQMRYKTFYNECDALIVHNKYSKDLLMKSFQIKSEKIAVIPRGIYENKGEVYLKKQQDTTEFLMFGKIRKYKGIDILLKAIALIPQEYRNKMHFIIAGQQFKSLDDTDYTGMIRDLQIGDCVSFISERISDQDKDRLFYQADACVCPYTTIYGSGVLLEAYTHGCPVICSDIPVFAEDTENGKTGMLFKSEDPEDLARVLKEFVSIKNKKHMEFRRNIESLVDMKYNWKVAAKKTECVYLGGN